MVKTTFNKTKILVNGRFLGRSMTGVKRFAVETLMALDACIGEDDPRTRCFDFEVVAPADCSETLPLLHIPVCHTGRRSSPLWEQLDLRHYDGGQHWLINLCNSAPIGRRKQIAFIHDVATVRVARSYRWSFRAWYALLIPRLYQSADAIFTVSEFSRRELASLYGHRDKVLVVGEGTEHMARIHADHSVLDRCHIGDRPFLLAVGSPAWHKNLDVVVQALSSLPDEPLDLVIAGHADPQIFSTINLGGKARVKIINRVTDAELKALYERAHCFIFPSLYEGYGLPPTEAMVCGCPVIASRQEAVVATTAGAALYFEPHDAATLRGLILRVLHEPGLASQLRAQGAAVAAELSWRKTAQALLDYMALACR